MSVWNRREIVEMLETENGSAEYFQLLHRAFQMSQDEFGGKGYIFAQIGLNSEPCPANCKFCTFAKDFFSAEKSERKSREEVLAEAGAMAGENVSDLFLMTTADYSFSYFLSMAEAVRPVLRPGMRFVANIGDFGPEEARQLLAAGFTGVYHIHRLGEGVDTDLPSQQRIQTIESAVAAGLELYYCVEPIGPEHTYEQIADEIVRAVAYGVNAMAVMRRVPVPGTPKADMGMTGILEFAKIAAAARIAVAPKRSMNAHETNALTLLAGVNQLYAEVGTNPRDQNTSTEKGRGLTAADCEAILRDAGYQL